MLNITDVTSYYIEHKFINEMKILVLDAFSLLESFQLKGYEEKYIDLINSYNVISSEDMYTSFINYLVKDLNNVIESHGVVIDTDGSPEFSDLIELCHLLLLLANLEDYSFVSYRVNTEQTSRITFVDLVERYTLLSRPRAMEVIGSVKESLIETLRRLSEDSVNNDEPIDLKHLKYVNTFFTYIGDIPCLATTLKEKGFHSNLNLSDLINLQTFDIADYVQNLSTINLAQTTLDIFSLLVYTVDDFNLPMFKFKKNSHLFTSNSDLSMRLTNTLFAMVNDFSVFLKACEEKEKANVN